jgi:fatty-acyl-CoA synthase
MTDVPTEQGFTNPERQLVSIAHMIARAAEIHPDRIAIEDLLNGVRISYRDLHHRICGVGRALRAQGVAKNDIIATMFCNEAAAVEVMMACAMIGAIVAPVNVRLLPAEVAEYVNAHACKAIVARADFIEKFADAKAPVRIARGAAAGWLDYEALIARSGAGVMPVVTSLEDPFRMIPTGGTTGMSKGVVHSHGGTYFTVLSNIAEFGIGRGWKTVMIAPSYHGAGMDWGMLPILWRAGTVIFPQDVSFNPQRYFDEIRRHSVEFLLLVPAVIGPLYRAWDRKPLTSPRVVISTSAPTPLPLRQKLAEMFPNAGLRAGAGISESLNMAIQDPADFLPFPNGVGEPHLCTRIAILDADDEPVAPGEAGQICLRGFNTALYYHGNSAAGAQTWRKRKGDPEGLEWCFTGDVGVLDREGRLSIVDRTKDIILSGGETVPSVEIEVVYMEHPSLNECAAIGLEDERWGEGITLVVVKNDSAIDDAALAEDLFAFGRKRLAPYKVPKQVAFVDALPRSHFGKVLKRELRHHKFDRLLRPGPEKKIAVGQ